MWALARLWFGDYFIISASQNSTACTLEVRFPDLIGSPYREYHSDRFLLKNVRDINHNHRPSLCDGSFKERRCKPKRSLQLAKSPIVHTA